MYYNGKRDFYVRQYGPTVLLVVFSLVLIGSGLYIYLSSTSFNKKPANVSNSQVVAQNNDEKTNNSTIEITTEEIKSNESNLKAEEVKTTTSTDENITTSDVLPDDLNNLATLQKSPNITVKSISNDGKIIIEYNNVNYELNMIGVDLEQAQLSIIKKMNDDLVNKTINVAFDKEKVNNSNIYAYIYINDELYNKTLLQKGYATLRVERTNITLLDELLKAQLSAKSDKIGVWRNI